MRRLIYGIVLVLLVCSAVSVSAQQPPPPAATEEPLPLLPPDESQVIEPTVEAPPALPFGDELPLLVNARTDLELLANAVMGAERPLGWSGNLDVTNPQLMILLRLDLELLAGRVVGPDQRPTGWFGAVASTNTAIARDIRHDLELLADTYGPPGVRPPGWAGADPLLRCGRAVQTLVVLLERGGVFTLSTDPNAPDFCAQAELQASRFAEVNLLSVPVSAAPTGGADQGGAVAPIQPGQIYVSTGYTVAFLNRYGTEQVGVIPLNTAMTPIARSTTEFSRMTLVEGDGFTVFVDYRTTSLADAAFATLLDINSIDYTTSCNAAWCTGVVRTNGSPAARRSSATTATGSGPGGRIRVPVEHVVIYYDGQDSNGTTVVRMELCSQPTSTGGGTCEHVTEIVAPDGSPLAPVGTLNGYAQFRVPYGYTTTSPRTRTYYMVDMWIAQPGEHGRPR
ncbi:MAG: hypothetical protein K8I60_23040 [Anaerolineae bacterium]|nr:hypothetical protein [Anaerolineae bacterium]